MNTRKILLLCAWLLAISLTQAQVPQLISYQAVARDLTGKVLSEKPISVQVEILQGSNQGTAVYTETHELTTTKTGTINLLIGGGNAQVGAFAEIDWGKAPYFLRLGMKQEKEAEYTEVSNTQMVSVPYALYAQYANKAGSVDNKVDEGVIRESDYTFLPVDTQDEPTELYTALSGGTIKIEKRSESIYYSFEFSLAYLTGTDLQLTAEIEGFKKQDKYCSASSPKGRHYTFIFRDSSSATQIPTKLTIKDKNGNIVATYPFTLQIETIK